VNVIIWTIVVFVILLDQVSKFFIAHTLSINESVTVVKNFFHITFISNTGAAFGIFKNQTLLFTSVSFISIAAIVAFMRKKRDSHLSRDIGFALILAGAAGNLTDRARCW